MNEAAQPHTELDVVGIEAELEKLGLRASPYASELERTRPAPDFREPAESQFRAEFVTQNLARLRAGFFVAVVIYAGFLIQRLLVESGPAAVWGFSLRLLVIAAMALTLLLSYLRSAERLPPVIVAAYVAFGAGVTAIEIVADRYGAERHYEGLLLVSIHCYVFSTLRYRQALFAMGLVFLFYASGGWIGGLAGRRWAYELLFLALTNTIGALALYMIERVERDNFLRRHLIHDLALRDGLTGLFNRVAFYHYFGRVWRQAQRDGQTLGLMMLDLDLFKQFNDRYGHPAGDDCLRRLGELLSRHFRRPLDVCARWGGEEFIGLWYGIRPDVLERFAEEIRADIAGLGIPHADSPFRRVTASIGAITAHPRGHETLDALIARADEALYAAKAAGRNRAVVRTSERPPAEAAAVAS